MTPHLKKSINHAFLENGTYEQIVSHLERELKLNGLEAPDEMQINTVTQQATQQNSENHQPTCHHCKKPGHYGNQCRQSSTQARKRPNSEKTRIVLIITPVVVRQFLTLTTVSNNTNANNTNNKKDRKPRFV